MKMDTGKFDPAVIRFDDLDMPMRRIVCERVFVNSRVIADSRGHEVMVWNISGKL